MSDWKKRFDEEFVFQTGDWTELGGEPDHQEFVGKPEDVKAFIHSVREEARREGLIEALVVMGMMEGYHCDTPDCNHNLKGAIAGVKGLLNKKGAK